MKTFHGSLALVVFGAVMLCGIGPASAGTDAPPMAGKPCVGCPQAAADNSAAPPMMDRMKAHRDRMKSALADLRESETKLAATEDPKAFRAAVIEHLKKLDDLQASYMTHMESMMGRMHAGRSGMDRSKCPHCKCKDSKCKDCMQKDDCCCKGDGPPGCDHSH